MATWILSGKLFGVATLVGFGEKRCRKNLPLYALLMSSDIDLKQLEDVLEGLNYTVFFHVYESSLGSDSDTVEIISSCLPDATVGNVVLSDPDTVLREFERDVQYRGDTSHGPEPGTIDSPKFRSIFSAVRSRFHDSCTSADTVHAFWLREGHPAYPVFWDFAYLLRFGDRSEIWIGSSSD